MKKMLKIWLSQPKRFLTPGIEGAKLLTMKRPKKGRHHIKKSPQQTQAEKEGMG